MTGHLKRLVAAVIVAISAMTASAQAEDLKLDTYFGWLSVGTTYTIVEGHVFWVGEFSGTMTDNGAGSILDNAAIQCPAWFDIDFNNNTASAGGYCITTTAGGGYVISWTCTGGPPFSGIPCDGGSEVIAASGEFEGLTGTTAFQATTVLFHPNGNGSGFSTIQLDLNLP